MLLNCALATFFYALIFGQSLGSNLNFETLDKVSRMKKRHVESFVDSSALMVGFAKASISPKIIDVFQDLNHNARFDDGEPYSDGNENHIFDGVWLAGFHGKRPAQGIHDDILAVAMVLKQGSGKIAIVSLDAIGFMRDEVGDVKRLLPESLGITELIVHSTHNHEVPDTQGLWGESFTKSGINQAHQSFIKRQIVSAIIEAERNLQPANLHTANIETDERQLGIIDTRLPHVIDNGIRSVIFTKADSEEVIGTIINFANHAETMWWQNLQITADWPGTVREGIENGRIDGSNQMSQGLGGICLVLNGNIGGLTTTLPDTPVFNFDRSLWTTGATFEKVKAQGYAIARSVENAWRNGSFKYSEKPELSFRKSIFELPINNKKFILAHRIGLIRREIFGQNPMRTKSEVSVLKLGDWQMLSLPGELYPEIALGGIETPANADFPGPVLETPPLKTLMAGEVNFVVNLVNDSIGYLIPYSQWDSQSPYTYGETDAPYGEENSMGPKTASIVHREAKALLEE